MYVTPQAVAQLLDFRIYQFVYIFMINHFDRSCTLLIKLHTLLIMIFICYMHVCFHIDSTVFFGQSIYSVLENIATIKLTLNLSKPLSRDINVTVGDNGNTATGK